MLEIVVKFIAIGGPVALAVMGFVVIDKPAKTSLGRAIWYGSFAVVALVSIVAAVIDAEEQEQRLNTMLTGGGDNFPELFGSLQPDQNGALPLQIATLMGRALSILLIHNPAAGGLRLLSRRSFACSRRFGSVNSRSNRAIVKSRRSSASSLVSVP